MYVCSDMRILSWNCNGAFRRKYQLLEKFDADILIIQECENPVLCKSQDYLLWACNFQWHGDSNHKGIGVFAKKNIVLTRNDWPDENLKYFLSVNVNGRFDLVNAWCHGANSPTFGYIGQFWKYLQINKQRMNNTLVAGDFNSNKIWDVWDRWWNHSDVIRELEEIGIRSLYHEKYDENQGEESFPTLFLQRNLSKPYHIDYAFASKALIPLSISFEIGGPEEWLPYSDHMPLLIEW